MINWAKFLMKIDLNSTANIQIIEIFQKIYLIHQEKATQKFTCCDGLILMPLTGRNSFPIIIDLNIEPNYISEVVKKFEFKSFGRFIYIVSHSHLDHSAHVHVWESAGAEIWAPKPHSSRLLDRNKLIDQLGFGLLRDRTTAFWFIETMGFSECSKVKEFEPGDKLEFDNLIIETIPLNGHSIGHIGFLLSKNDELFTNVEQSLPWEGLFHISCLGFDLRKPDGRGFGPWYGFPECSISQYKRDIDLSEEIFLNKARLLTSSHSYPVDPNKMVGISPFEYIRSKIELNNQKVLDILDKLGKLEIKSEELAAEDIEKLAGELLEFDIFFPKSKMKGKWREIYELWEYWIIFNTLNEVLK